MKKVYVGMSGGVDSSVTAALCKKQGYQVTGVYMKNWTRDVGGAHCPWQEDLADAKSVAALLDIPFKVFDFETQYRQKVVQYMIDEYQSGLTPNPDIMCNQEIKFKLFLDTARQEGADLIATGHYARIKDGSLFAGLDDNKDQSYFLYRVTSKALKNTLFPLGDYTKIQVRQIAKELSLPTAAKPDSQGICFIGEVSIKEFLSQYIDPKPGPIKHIETKQVLGEHDGAVFYTLGQRHGLDIGGIVKGDSGGGLPLYVIDKDIATNTVYVTEKLDALRGNELNINNTHWISQPPQADRSYLVRSRHRGKLSEAKVVLRSNNAAHISMEDFERALTPGQSTVIYEETPEGLKVLGGGVIRHPSLPA